MLLRKLQIKNLLSFGPNGLTLSLRPLNVLIGPNGSGKSNFIEAIGLLQSAPRLLASPVRDGGGIGDWLWKGDRAPTAHLQVIVDNPASSMPLRHTLEFTQTNQRFELVDEQIENESCYSNHVEPYFYYRFQYGRPVLNRSGNERDGGGERSLRREEVDLEKSILSQRKDPDHYPEITFLGEQFDRIRIYREWSFGRYTPPRQPQKADQRNDFLEENCANLGLMLNRLRRDVTAKSRLLEMLVRLYPDVQDFDVSIEGGTVQVFLHEGRFSIPATRLSDGTLRYLCLLVLLCQPSPPPLLCIEEPELGLHPDALVGIGELLKEASTRTQLVVTTHSEVLVDSLSQSPEDVVVCEKQNGESTMRRLEQPALAEWLKKYSLGQLWRRGEIGGNRW
jgi:predicted ATPase